MAISEAQRRAVAKYNAANYERVELRLKRGKKNDLKAHAEARGESLNEFVNRAIDQQIDRDSTSPAPSGSPPAPFAAADSPQPIPAPQTSPEAAEQPQGDVLHLVELGAVSPEMVTVRRVYVDTDTRREYYVEPIVSDDDWRTMQDAKQVEVDDNSLPF